MYSQINNNAIAMTVMAAITSVNLLLAITFVVAAGSALAAVFDSQNIYFLAGAELILVLLAYIFGKNGPARLPLRSR